MSAATGAGATAIWAVIAGGGTAGHVLPGVSIARALVARGCPASAVHFVGSVRGVEADLVPAAGFTLTRLPGRGLQRRPTLDNIGAVFGLLRALVQSFLLVRRLRPSVVVGLGGYASVPCGVAARLNRVPVVVAEQNAVPGAANRMVGRWARAAAVSFEGTDLPRATVTGNPVRDEILAVDREGGRARARHRLGVDDDRLLVTVFGGSLGARRINQAVQAAATVWHDRDDLHIRHITGRRDHDDMAARLPVDDLAPLTYDLVEFEPDMAAVYAGSDLVVCRAGATTVAELATVGCPAVLVPLPGAPGDHQTANARALADAGGARLVPDDELDAARLVAEVDALLDDPDRRAAMSSAARRLARPDAADSVAEIVCRHAREPFPEAGPGPDGGGRWTST